MYFLVIGQNTKSLWLREVHNVLCRLGKVELKESSEIFLQIPHLDFDLVVIDAHQADEDVVALVELLHCQEPRRPIIVGTMSPTWRRARQVFLAGATDYIRKSFDSDITLTQFKNVLDRSISDERYSYDTQ